MGLSAIVIIHFIPPLFLFVKVFLCLVEHLLHTVVGCVRRTAKEIRSSVIPRVHINYDVLYLALRRQSSSYLLLLVVLELL